MLLIGLGKGLDEIMHRKLFAMYLFFFFSQNSVNLCTVIVVTPTSSSHPPLISSFFMYARNSPLPFVSPQTSKYFLKVLSCRGRNKQTYRLYADLPLEFSPPPIFKFQPDSHFKY